MLIPAGLAVVVGAATLTPAFQAPTATGAAAAVDRQVTPGKRKDQVVDVYEKVKGSVVNIHSERTVVAPAEDPFNRQPVQPQRVNGMGTGIVLDPRGYILTNFHVVDDVQPNRVGDVLERTPETVQQAIFARRTPYVDVEESVAIEVLPEVASRSGSLAAGRSANRSAGRIVGCTDVECTHECRYEEPNDHGSRLPQMWGRRSRAEHSRLPPPHGPWRIHSGRCPYAGSPGRDGP
jgi:hypothetical protein